MAATNILRDPVDICLGAAFQLASHGRKDVAVAAIREALGKDPDLRPKLQTKLDRWSVFINDKMHAERPAFIERTMHPVLQEALTG